MIEKLFTSKNRIKMLEYFMFCKQKAKIREVSKEIEIPVSAVSRELKNLAEIGILKKGRDGFCLNKNCNFLSELRSILLKTDSFMFEIEKHMKKTGANFIFIFGSFANNTYKQDSDIDLFIVGSIESLAVNKMLKPVETKLGRDINPVIWTLDELKKKSGNGFIKQIAKGNIIMIKGDENELRKIIGRR